jgi:CheY-like chemotaxis protein
MAQARGDAMRSQADHGLSGKRILVVEDEFMIAEGLAGMLEQCGVEVVGPAPTVGAALALATTEDQLDCAILDINLRGQMSYPVADALQERGIPFVFATGYDAHAIPERHSHIVRCEKPIPSTVLIQALNGL